MSGDATRTTWRVRNRRTGYEWQGPLIAAWEVHLDPMSDDYTPDDVDALELLRMWAGQVRKLHPDELIPIFWFVECLGQGKLEQMPFQCQHGHGGSVSSKDLLSFNTWPVDSRKGQPLNWLTLPVIDKRWNKGRADQGGFIQEATGWKPSILQPTVYLPPILSVFL